MTHMNKRIAGPHAILSGKVRWQILQRGRVVRDSETSNPQMVLNQGLDQVASYFYGQLSTYCAVGTGNAAPIETQVGLVAEVARTNNYLTGAGNCGLTVVNGYTGEYKRTYDFPLGALNGTYYELGFSPVGTAGNNLFSRTLIKDALGNPSGIVVNADQQLRVIYVLTVTIGPSSATAGSCTFSGFGTVNYTHAIQDALAANTYGHGLSGIVTTGIGIAGSAGTYSVLEPSQTGRIAFVSTSTAALAAVGSFTARGAGVVSKTMTDAAYVSGNYYRDRTLSLSLSEANEAIGCVGIGDYQFGHAYLALLSPAFTKDNVHTLSITFRLSWGRA